jgi:hypothetical protein
MRFACEESAIVRQMGVSVSNYRSGTDGWFQTFSTPRRYVWPSELESDDTSSRGCAWSTAGATGTARHYER